MSARSVDASTSEGYAAALLLLHMRVAQFNLPSPAGVTRFGGYGLNVQISQADGRAAVDAWVSALGLPAASDRDGDPYPATKTRSAWREYFTDGVAEGVGLHVWCSVDVVTDDETADAGEVDW